MRRKDRRIPLKQKKIVSFFIFGTPRIKLVGNILKERDETGEWEKSSVHSRQYTESKNNAVRCALFVARDEA